MKRWFSIVLILIGIICCFVAVYPIFHIREGVNESLEKWEDTGHDRGNLEDGMIGVLQINGDEKLIPIHIGTGDEVLNQGVGLDELTVYPGDKGNSVLYGHRENILWGLKDVKIGDLITIENLDTILVFEVKDTQVVDPYDPYIYEKTQQPTITLVTCYPFIYMGPTPQRFVVRAELKEN